METLNMMGLTVDKFVNEIKMDLEDENYDPVIGIGKSGVGKTMSIYELTQELGIGFCELRLVTLSEVDLLGIPDTVVDGNGNKRTTYASNELLPDEKRDGKRGILVLDEITSATSTIRAAAYQLLDSKRALGNYKLPDEWKVVALGNGPDDGGVFQGIEAAFISRCYSYRVEPDLDSWKKWAIPNGVNPSVIAYLSFDPSKLHVFDPDEMASVFPCPRSWTALSKKLNKREARNKGTLDREAVEIYAAGAIGETEAALFAGFYAYNKDTISVEDIIAGKSNGADIQSLPTEAAYIIIQQLITQLSKDVKEGFDGMSLAEPALTKVVNAINWIIDAGEVRLDYMLTGIKDLVSGVPQLQTIMLMDDNFYSRCPNFDKISKENSIVFKAN